MTRQYSAIFHGCKNDDFQMKRVICIQYKENFSSELGPRCFAGVLLSTYKVPNTTMAVFANTVDSDEMAHQRLMMSCLIRLYSVCPLVFDFST